MLVALLEGHFLEEGRVNYCSASVLWRDDDLAGQGWVVELSMQLAARPGLLFGGWNCRE